MRLNIESGNWSLSVKLYIKSFSQCFDFLWLKPTKRQENAAVSCFHICQPWKTAYIYKLMSFTPASRQIFGCLRTKPVHPCFLSLYRLSFTAETAKKRTGDFLQRSIPLGLGSYLKTHMTHKYWRSVTKVISVSLCHWKVIIKTVRSTIFHGQVKPSLLIHYYSTMIIIHHIWTMTLFCG